MTSLISDNELEIRKFKMFADKVDTEAKVIDLCKKYLKHKGIDVDMSKNTIVDYLQPKEPMKIYVGMSDIHTISSQFTIDGIDMSATQMSDQMMMARRHITESITYELFKNDLIDIKFYKMMDTYQTKVIGKVHVWKDPTK